MNCKFHNNIKATNTCSVCGEWICENCVLEIEGRIYCKDCLKQKIRNEKPTETSNVIPSKTHTGEKVYKSSFLTFLCSSLPGCGQMYLGYTKRGLFILSIFLLGAFIEFFTPLVLISYCFGLFDAFKLKGNLQRGIYQEDNVSDIKKFIRENNSFIFILTLVIVVPMILDFFDDLFFNLNRIGHHTFYGFSSLDFDEFLEVGMIGLILLINLIFIVKAFKNHKRKDEIEKINIDDKNQNNKMQ